MSVCRSIFGAIESSVIDLVLRKGSPVVEPGQENKVLFEHGYGHTAWKDPHVQKHVKGSLVYNHENSKWITTPVCEWNASEAIISKDSVDEKTGILTLEISNLFCNCGQYAQKTMRYSGKAPKVLAEITSTVNKVVSIPSSS